jgi:hypothetical protein
MNAQPAVKKGQHFAKKSAALTTGSWTQLEIAADRLPVAIRFFTLSEPGEV